MSDTATAVASAPATGSPSGSAGSAPSTFEQAFAQDASPASSTPDGSTTSPATAQPGTDQGSPQPVERSPFIPRERFDEVNTKLNELKAWRESRAWAEQVQPETFREMQAWYQRAAQDPVAFAQHLISDLQSHPVHGQALRSLAAKALAAGRGQAQPEMPSPDVSITDAAGNVVGQTYSDRQLAERDKWVIAQVMQQVRQEIAPMQQSHERITREHEAAERTASAKAWGESFGKEMAAAPGFQDYKQAIQADVAAEIQKLDPNDPRSDDQHVLENLTLRAYMRVVPKAIQAKAQTTAESTVLDNLKRKAGAAVSVNPGSAAPSSPRNVTRFDDPSLTW